MATKSVIEIDVLDEKFKSFVDAFEKYQSALKKMPNDWQKVSAAANQSSAAVSKNIAQAAKNQKDLNKAISDGTVGFRNAAKITKDIAGNMASAAFSAAKWLATASAGGYLAMAALAGRASGVRREAQGYGITTGQLRSANVNLGKYIDPAGVLSNIAEVQADLSRGQILSRLGGKQGQNPADMLADVMLNATKQFKAGGQTQQYAEAMGLTQIFSMEELRRLASLTERELNDTIVQFKHDRELLAVDDSTSRAWQEFWIQLKRSGNLIETSFIEGLVGLNEPLKNLTNSVSETIAAFLKSDELKSAIDSIATTLKDPEFHQAAKDFMEGIKDIAGAVAWVISKIPHTIRGFRIAGEKIFGTTETPKVSAVDGTIPNKIAAGLIELGVKNPEAIAGFMGGIYGESGFNPTAKNDLGGGHYGIAQWGKTRQADFERLFGKPIQKSTIDEQVRFMQWELQNKEQGTLKQLLAAKSREAGVQANLTYERPFTQEMSEAQKKAEMDRRLSYASNIRVDVSSSAGSDINVSAKGLPR